MSFGAKLKSRHAKLIGVWKNMNFISDLNTVSSRVHLILQTYPETRDSDKLLWLAYNSLHNDLKSVIKSGDYFTFKMWILQNNTPIFESLSRARRKIQQQFPELEGQKEARLETEKEVRDLFSQD